MAYFCIFVTQITKYYEFSKKKQQHLKVEIKFKLMKT